MEFVYWCVGLAVGFIGGYCTCYFWGKSRLTLQAVEQAEVERLQSALEKLEDDYDTALQKRLWNIELEEAKDEISRLSHLMKSDVDAYKELEAEYEQLMNRISIGNEIKYEVDCENERLRSALEKIVPLLRQLAIADIIADDDEVIKIAEAALKG
jgi:DNA repair exonuclease SbcCD ATPase subunit